MISTPTEAKPLTLGLALAVFVIGVFAFLEVYAIQAILPILMHDFNASPAEIGFTVGATVLAVAIMSPFMGMLSDAIGRKKVIVASLLFLAFPTAMLGFSSSLSQMNVWRFLQGLAVPGITVVLIAYIGEEFSGKAMTRLMTLYVSGTVLGGFSGRFILGHLTDYMSWQHAFWVMAAMMLAGVALAYSQLPASKNFVANAHLKPALQGLWSHLHNRYVLSAMLLGSCVLFSLVGCFTFINLHLAAEPYHLSSSDLANIYMVYLIGMVITPLSTQIIGRFGAKKNGVDGRVGVYGGRVGYFVCAAVGHCVGLGHHEHRGVHYPSGHHQLHRQERDAKSFFGIGFVLHGLLHRRHHRCHGMWFGLCARGLGHDSADFARGSGVCFIGGVLHYGGS